MMRFRTGILRIGRGVLTAALLIGVTTGSIFAEEQKGINDELKEMKERLEVLEKAQQVTTDGAGHKLHPVHSVFGIKISGGLTGIYQGSLGNRKEFGGNRAEGQMSADLFLESPIGD
jgi:hypothetical protein